MDFKKKRLLILGGNPETGSLVSKAQSMGVHTIVVDPNPNAPAKKFANESYDMDAMDVNGLYALSKNLNLDGVLVGVADILVPAYQALAEKLDFPCYATDEIIKTFCFKDGFIDACKNYNIDTIPSYKTDGIPDVDMASNIEYPVMVKPVDNGGGIGMHVCWNLEELIQNSSIAMQNSKKGQILIERFMSCPDLLAYYTFKDGEIYLSAIADRITTKKQGNVSPVCIGAIYPSKYTNQFLGTINPKLVSMFQDLGVQNGVLNLQFFYENQKFYTYDPGFRLQGEAPHIHINAVNDFNSQEMLINFALSGSMSVDDLEHRNDYYFKNTYSSTLWILLKDGVITNINGLNTIQNNPAIIDIIQRFALGDEVTPEMVGNERQVFARIYLNCDSLDELKEKIKFVNSTLIIEDADHNNMIIDYLNVDDLKGY
jgi:biotin carboxylase